MCFDFQSAWVITALTIFQNVPDTLLSWRGPYSYKKIHLNHSSVDMNWRIDARRRRAVRTPDVAATRLIPFPRQLSKHCIMRDVLSSGAKREEVNDGDEEGGGRQRHAARLNQQPLVFNPPQKVRTTFFYRTTAAKPLWHRTSCLVE